MITGDAKDTAVAVGHSIGIDVEKRNVISGEQLESMDVYELKRVINEVTILCSCIAVSPLVVRHLQLAKNNRTNCIRIDAKLALFSFLK